MKALLALLVFALLCAGIWFTTLRKNPDAPGLSPDSRQATTVQADPSTELAPALTSSANDRSLALDGLGSDPGADAAERLWVTGRVLLPDGVPLDPTLEVFALTERLNAAQLASVLGPKLDFDTPSPVLITQRARRQATIRARAVVEQDGSFHLPWPAATRAGFLGLMGQHLYLEHAQVLDPRVQEQVLVRPSVGIHIRGQLTRGPGAQGTLAGIPLRITIDRSNLAGMTFDPQDISPTRIQSSDAEGRFSFRAALPVANCVVEALPQSTFAFTSHPLGPLTPGTSLAVELEMTTGATIQGQVMDTNGRPVADARITTTRAAQAFGVEGSTVRQATSDSDGVFHLVAVPVEELVLVADHDEYLESRPQVVEIPSSKQLSGVSLQLEEGGRLTGSVRWQDGSPAADVSITAQFDSAYNVGLATLAASRGATGRTQSDANGIFVLSGLGTGPFSVFANAKPAGSARKDGLRPGQEGLEFVLSPEVALEGFVVDQEGAPVPAFSIYMARISSGDLLRRTGNGRRMDVKNEQGAFRIGALEEGTWSVQAQGDGVISPGAIEVQLPLPDGTPPLTVTTLRSATVSGRVLTPEGLPMEGAQVRASTGPGGWQELFTSDGFPLEGTSDDQGAYTITGIPPGGISISAEVEGYAPSAGQALDLAAGESRADTDLMLTLGGTITGEVLLPDESSGAGFLITCNNVTTQAVINTNTGPDGTFHMDFVPAGSWQVIAMNPAADWKQAGKDGGVDMAAMMKNMLIGQANVVDGESVHVKLGSAPEDPVLIRGKVTQNEAPVEGAMISFFPEGAGIYERLKFTSVENDGSYEVTLDAPGTYVVSVQRMGDTPMQQSTIEFSEKVPETTEHRIDFELPVGRLSGTVTNDAGRPAAGERVTLTVDGVARSDNLLGGQFAETLTGQDGSFDLTGLRPGVYRIAAGGAPPFANKGSDRLGRVSIDNIQLSEDEWQQGLRLELPKPGAIEVAITDFEGNPLPGATLFVRNEAGRMLEPFSLVASDGSGSVTYGGIAPGEYFITARAGPLTAQESGPIQVRSGEKVRSALVLEPGTVLWLKFSNADREPLAASVSVTDENGREVSGMVGIADMRALYIDGAFSPAEHRLGPLPPGKYRVHAEADGKVVEKRVRLRGEAEKRLTLRIK